MIEGGHLFITGANRGLGRAFVQQALALGAIAGGMLHKLAQDHSPAILCAMAFLLFCDAALVEKGRTDDPPADEGI